MEASPESFETLGIEDDFERSSGCGRVFCPSMSELFVRGFEGTPGLMVLELSTSDGGLYSVPGGGERTSPAVATLSNAGAFPKSTLPRCSLLRLRSAIQAGCCNVAGDSIFGDSGLLMAFSSQLDFVGLHLLLGLVGGLVNESPLVAFK